MLLNSTETRPFQETDKPEKVNPYSRIGKKRGKENEGELWPCYCLLCAVFYPDIWKKYKEEISKLSDQEVILILKKLRDHKTKRDPRVLIDMGE